MYLIEILVWIILITVTLILLDKSRPISFTKKIIIGSISFFATIFFLIFLGPIIFDSEKNLPNWFRRGNEFFIILFLCIPITVIAKFIAIIFENLFNIKRSKK